MKGIQKTGRLLLATGLALALVLLAAGYWIPAKAGLSQILLERAWHAVRAGNDDARPWPWADTAPIARLSIPQLDAAWIVLAGASGRNLAFAPAHMDGSAPPGAQGVAVISAHRDTHFAVLEYLETDMEILLEDSAGATHRYQVTGIEVVDSATAQIRLDAEEPWLVLSTCYPFNALTAGGSLRFVVQARAIAPIPA